MARARKAKDGGRSFGEVAADFIASRQRDEKTKLTEQTHGQYEAVFRLFKQFAGDPPLVTIEREQASEFFERIASLHPNWGHAPDAKQLTYAEVMVRFGGHPTGLSNRTVNRYVSSLSGLFKWAKKKGWAKGVENPFEGQLREKASRRATGWLPFNEGELEKLFRSDLFMRTSWAARVTPEKHDFTTALLWVPLIALFSGMRQNEVCQLRPFDVKEEHGILFFDVTEELKVKTEASIRRVPMHSELVRCGFRQYLAALPEGAVPRSASRRAGRQAQLVLLPPLHGLPPRSRRGPRACHVPQLEEERRHGAGAGAGTGERGRGAAGPREAFDELQHLQHRPRRRRRRPAGRRSSCRGSAGPPCGRPCARRPRAWSA